MIVKRQGILPSGTTSLQKKQKVQERVVKDIEDDAHDNAHHLEWPFNESDLAVHIDISAQEERKPYFTHDHVRAIEEGTFLYDPGHIQKVLDIGQRLANLDNYVSDSNDHDELKANPKHPQSKKFRFIDSRMTEVLLSDLEDFLQLNAKMLNKIDFLRSIYISRHVEIVRAAGAQKKERNDHKKKQMKREEDGRLREDAQALEENHEFEDFAKLFEENKRSPFCRRFWDICSSIWEWTAALIEAIWWFLNMKFWPEWFIKRLDKKYHTIAPRVYSVPHSVEKEERQQTYGIVFNALLELLNIITDVFFFTTNIKPLRGTAGDYLFIISVAAFAATASLRFIVGAWDWRSVDWKNKHRSWTYFFGFAYTLIDPNTGFNTFVKKSFVTRELLSYNIIGDAVGSFVKDPIATQAKTDLKAAQMSIFIAFVLLVQDIPQAAVTFIFILKFSGGDIGPIDILALFSSLLSAGRQLIESIELLHDIPGLRNIIFARHLVFNPNNDIDMKIVGALEKEEACHKKKGDHRDNRYTAMRMLSPKDDKADRGEKGGFIESQLYNGKVAFHHGQKLNCRVIAKYFNFNRSPEPHECMVWPIWFGTLMGRLLFWLVTLILAFPTLGYSLFWKPFDLSSRGAFYHFRDTLRPSIVMEGKPFGDLGKVSELKYSHGIWHCAKLVRVGCSALWTSTVHIPRTLLFNRMEPRNLFRCIRTVELTDCLSINDSTLELIAAMCPNLQNLNLSFCADVTDAGLHYFSKNRCIALASVVLDGCIKVTNNGVGHIINASKKSLWRLSLRDLPLLKVEILQVIAEHCTALRFLNLDVDALYQENFVLKTNKRKEQVVRREAVETDRKEAQKGAFLHITKSKHLVELLKRCSSLQTLMLGNILDDNAFFNTDKEWRKVVANLNPSIRYLSLHGATSFNSKHLEILAQKATFLRNLYISGATNLESAICLKDHCHSLRVVSMSGTAAPMSDADAFFMSVAMPDVEVALIDSPPELADFYVEQLRRQLEEYRDLELPKPPFSLTATLCCRGSAGKFDRYMRRHVEYFKDEMEKVEKMHENLKAFLKEYKNKLKQNMEMTTQFLSLVVGLVDFVRRTRWRLEVGGEALSTLWEGQTAREEEELLEFIKHLNSFIEAFKNSTGFSLPLPRMLAFGPEASDDKKTYFDRERWDFPLIALPTFGIMPTRRLNLKIDFKWNRYEFICPDVFESVFSLRKPDGKVLTRLTGAVSNIQPLSVRIPEADNTLLLQRFWCIPPDARYFCYAFPLDHLRKEELDWFQFQRPDDTVRRFLHFGGFLYFDEDQHFLSASALTVGTTLSFNGPFKLPSWSIEKLNKEKRWQNITMKAVRAKDAEVKFCYVFSNEEAVPKTLRKKEDRSVAPTTSVDEDDIAITVDVDDRPSLAGDQHSDSSTSLETDDENTFKTCFGCLRPKKNEKITMRKLREDETNVYQSLVDVERKCQHDADKLVRRQGAFPSGTTRLVKQKKKDATVTPGSPARRRSTIVSNFSGTDSKKKSKLAAEDDAKPFFTHDHVRAIEDGDFLYDPALVQAVVDVGQRLANLDHYVSDSGDHECLKSYNSQDDHPQQDRVRFIDSRMTEVLLSDVEDFLHIISKMINKMEFLRDCYRSKHVSILEDARAREPEAKTRMRGIFSPTAASTCSSVAQKVGQVSSYLRWYAIQSFPATFKGTLDRRFKHATPRLYTLPHTIEKRRRLRIYGSAFDAILEVTNIVSDLFFLVTQLMPLTAGDYGYLYYVSLAALTLTFTARFAIGLWDYKLVDWDDAYRSRMYVFGVLLGIIEPNSGFNDFIKESFKIQESLSYNIIGDAVGSFVKDPISTQAKADYKAAHMSIWTAIVLLIQDIPQIVVEVIFIIVFQGGEFEFVYWLALLTSLLSAFRQLIEAVFLLRDIPGLHNLILVRHLVFNPNNDIDYKILGAMEKSKGDKSGDDVPVEFYYGKTLVSKALTKFFNWKSSLAASWSAYHHFRSEISHRVRSDGKPFEEGQTSSKKVSSAISCTSMPCMGSSEDGDASRLSSILIDPLFGRMDSKTLFRSIRSVQLTGCTSINDDILKLISCMCPNLQNLDLNFCTNITDEGLEHFKNNRCIALGSVVLDGCIEVTSLGVCHIAECSGKNLWRLSLRDLPSLDKYSLEPIAKYCTGLRFLALDVNLLIKDTLAKEAGNNRKFLSIQDTGLLIELLKRCSSLETLKVSNVLGKKFTGWEDFAKNINPYLRTLSLAGAATFNDAALESLAKKALFLRELRLSGVRSLKSAKCLLKS
ncbi:F-box/LRR-repeat protein 7 [Hondaea fermentalgiana]|uniref:F-box/LRR-repeat protein 7 n=1 Tax=Hondaea fermentalgiana TaxID=2315210 RepID=A0A2R5GKE1_9STRA|nr:F-box/LRR-repeat protein 7 [Hondaea fermentalgiana]|eukprot:GBG29093.1 F-box/LRR-repeat protein 7 [Hondaea fermentalgiana]